MAGPGPLSRVEIALVGAILVAGGALRFSGLDQGIPFSIGVDEPEILERAVRMMKTGDFHPAFLFAASAAAVLLAFQPMHVRESHYILTDVPMTFFVALTMLCTLRAHERPTWRAYVWPGVPAGLAAATKYHGGAALLLPLITLAMHRYHPARTRCVAAAIAGADVAPPADRDVGTATERVVRGVDTVACRGNVPIELAVDARGAHFRVAAPRTRRHKHPDNATVVA